jgi:hypothetical protein
LAIPRISGGTQACWRGGVLSALLRASWQKFLACS